MAAQILHATPLEIYMRKFMRSAASCCLLAIPTYASETCGIGTAIKRMQFVEHPLISDFEVPGRVILQQAESNPPFHFCGDRCDLKPGIEFMNKYIDRLVSAGASENEPDIATLRLTVTGMKKLSAQRRWNKKKQLPSLSAQIAPSHK